MTSITFNTNLCSYVLTSRSKIGRHFVIARYTISSDIRKRAVVYCNFEKQTSDQFEQKFDKSKWEMPD